MAADAARCQTHSPKTTERNQKERSETIMTFADTKTIPNRSVVFFPACLGGSLDNALKQEGITDWQILTPEQAVREFGIDGRQIPPVKLYEDMTMTTNNIRVLVSNFKPDEILHKIYMLH